MDGRQEGAIASQRPGAGPHSQRQRLPGLAPPRFDGLAGLKENSWIANLGRVALAAAPVNLSICQLPLLVWLWALRMTTTDQPPSPPNS